MMDELATLDREAFAQVWSRVSAQGGGLVEVVSPEEPSQTGPQESGGDGELQALVLTCLTGAGAYQELKRRTRRSGAELTALAEQKTRQAKRLSAAYFLRTGVRYWPRDTVPHREAASFFSALRDRFLAEKQLAGELEAMASAARDELVELYADLARETGEMARAIRRIVEKET